MPEQRASQPVPKERVNAPKEQKQPTHGRSGEGARSVIPHLRADLRARAAAKIAQRTDRDF